MLMTKITTHAKLGRSNNIELYLNYFLANWCTKFQINISTKTDKFLEINFNKRLTPAKVCKTPIVELDLYNVNTKFEERLRKWKTWHALNGKIHSCALCPKLLTAKYLFETVDGTLKYDADKTITTKVPWSIMVKSTILKMKQWRPFQKC